jgi:hypothetical protein
VEQQQPGEHEPEAERYGRQRERNRTAPPGGARPGGSRDRKRQHRGVERSAVPRPARRTARAHAHPRHAQRLRRAGAGRLQAERQHARAVRACGEPEDAVPAADVAAVRERPVREDLDLLSLRQGRRHRERHVDEAVRPQAGEVQLGRRARDAEPVGVERAEAAEERPVEPSVRIHHGTGGRAVDGERDGDARERQHAPERRPPGASVHRGQSVTRRSRSAFAMTDTDESDMAALASIGDSSQPVQG